MSSKMVTDRQKNAANLLAVLDKHSAEANHTLATLVAPHLQEGEEAPDIVQLQEMLRRNLAHLDRRLVQADDANLNERRENRIQRRRRDKAARQVSELISRLRQAVDAACGSEACADLLGIEGPTPRDPVVLHRLGVRVLGSLQEKAVEEADSTLPGFGWDPVETIASLEGPVASLGEALSHLTLERRDRVSTYLRKRQAMKEYDVAYTSLARVMENLFRHTGLTDLAERVRPSSSSPRSLEDPIDDGPIDASELQEAAAPPPEVIFPVVDAPAPPATLQS